MPRLSTSPRRPRPRGASCARSLAPLFGECGDSDGKAGRIGQGGVWRVVPEWCAEPGREAAEIQLGPRKPPEGAGPLSQTMMKERADSLWEEGQGCHKGNPSCDTCEIATPWTTVRSGEMLGPAVRLPQGDLRFYFQWGALFMPKKIKLYLAVMSRGWLAIYLLVRTTQDRGNLLKYFRLMPYVHDEVRVMNTGRTPSRLSKSTDGFLDE